MSVIQLSLRADCKFEKLRDFIAKEIGLEVVHRIIGMNKIL